MARHARVTPLLGGVLVGSALAAGALLPGAGVAAATTASNAAPTALPTAKPAACDALDDAIAARKQAKATLAAAEADWSKKRSALTVAQAKLAADPDNDTLKLARDRAHDATGRAQSAYFLASNQANSAESDYTSAVRLAGKVDCGEGDGNVAPPGPKNPTAPTSKPKPPHGPAHPPHSRPGHAHPYQPAPAPVVNVESHSSSTAVAATGGPGAAGVVVAPVAETDGGGWFGSWGGDWLGGSSDDQNAGTGETAGEVVSASPQQTGSVVPLGSADTGDGSGAGVDVAHIGMAAAGLGALGLAGAGGAVLGGRRR